MLPTFLRRPGFASVCLAALFSATTVAAQGISVAPTRLEVQSGSVQTTIAVQSAKRSGAAVQMRVFAWEEGSPPDRLRATDAVVVSPPMAQLGPRQELTARIVRLAGTPPRGRECYRVLVDRLPDASQSPGQINLRIRHSVPLCFSG